MKIKNLTILSILSIALLTGCNQKDKIDEKIVAQDHTKIKHNETQSKKATPKDHDIKEKTISNHTENKEQTIYDFHLNTANGKNIKVVANLKKGWTFGNIKDKVILLDFFATWCPPCKAEIPHLNHIREKFGKDFEIIGVDIGKRGGGINSNQHLLDFQDTYGIDYPVVLGGDNSQLFGAVSSLNPQGSIPFMVLFSKNGDYIKYYIGMTAEEILTSDIKQAIKMK